MYYSWPLFVDIFVLQLVIVCWSICITVGHCLLIYLYYSWPLFVDIFVLQFNLVDIFVLQLAIVCWYICITVGHCLLTYLYYSWPSNYKKGSVGISLTGLILPYFVPVPKQVIDFNRLIYVIVFFFVQWHEVFILFILVELLTKTV
jgi:hypothetical protein